MKRFLKKVTSFVLLFATILNTVSNPLLVLAISSDYTNLATKGDVYDPITDNFGTNINNTSTITAGSTEKQGDVKMTKTVTKKNDTGLYTVEITVEGKDYVDTVPLPVYTVFVLDASSSMEGNPWKNAKLAAIEFSENLTKITNGKGEKINKISLITFDAGTLIGKDTGTTINPGFSTNAFTDSTFGKTGKGTNYNAGLYPAYQKIKEFRKTNPDDIVNVVFISDGSPNKSSCVVPANDSEFCNRYDGTYAAGLIKGLNAKIYSLAYNYKSDTYLKTISSNNKVYGTTSSNIKTVLDEIMKNEILTQPAAVNAKVYDMIGPNFTFVESNTNTEGVTFDKDTGVVTYNIGAIEEYMDANKTQKATYSFQFDIQIDVDSENGWYPTNNTNNVKVTNTYNNQETTLVEIDKTAEVYWVQNKYGYKVEYYYNGLLDASKTDVYDKVLAKGEKASITNQDIEDNLKEGYIYSSVTPGMEITISNNEAENVIRVYYVIDETQTKELTYTVEYYKDGVLVEEDTEEVNQVVQVLEPNVLNVNKENINTIDKYVGYKFLNTNPEIIPDTIENNGVIKVYYVFDEMQTKDLTYTVEYYKDGVLVEEDTETISETVHVLEDDKLTVNRENINTSDKYKGYEFESTNPEIIPEEILDGSVIKVYYVSGLYDYTIKHVELGNEDNVLDIEEGSQKYGTTIEVNEKTFEGFTYDSKDKEEIVIDTENNIAYVYYTRNNYSYTVEYYKENLDGDFELVEEDTMIYEDVEFNSEATYEVKEYENYTYDEDKTENSESKVPANNDLVIRLYYTLNESDVIVHYVVKVEDNYISFDKYGRDELGNNTPDFEGVKLEDDIFNGKIGSEFTTNYREVPEYNFIGLYEGNILENSNLSKLDGNKVTSTFDVLTKEYTYVYEAPMGDGEELPPQTGFEGSLNYLSYGLLIAVMYLLKKYFDLINIK